MLTLYASLMVARWRLPLLRSSQPFTLLQCPCSHTAKAGCTAAAQMLISPTENTFSEVKELLGTAAGTVRKLTTPLAEVLTAAGRRPRTAHSKQQAGTERLSEMASEWENMCGCSHCNRTNSGSIKPHCNSNHNKAARFEDHITQAGTGGQTHTRERLRTW